MKKTAEEKIDLLVDGFNRLDTHVSKLDAKVSSLDAKVSRLDSTVDKVVHELVDMKHYMHTELATKTEVRELRQEMLTNFDQQGVVLERLDHELAAHQGNTDRRLTRVEGHLGLKD